jgi:hypothetical protein
MHVERHARVLHRDEAESAIAREWAGRAVSSGARHARRAIEPTTSITYFNASGQNARLSYWKRRTYSRIVLRFAAEGITTVKTWSSIRDEALKNRLLLAIRAAI